MTNRRKLFCSTPFHQNIEKVSLFLSRARLPVSPHPSPGNLRYTDTETKLTGKSKSLVEEDEKICKTFKPKGSKGTSKKSAYANLAYHETVNKNAGPPYPETAPSGGTTGNQTTADEPNSAIQPA